MGSNTNTQHAGCSALWMPAERCSLHKDQQKETEADNVSFFDNSAIMLGSGQGLVDAAAKRDLRD